MDLTRGVNLASIAAMVAGSEAMVSLQGVSKSFGSRHVIQPTTFELAGGERLALIGPSGSGKSTFLRMILGLVTPDAGRIRVGGTNVTATTSQQVRRRVGYVIQNGGLFPHLTAERNVTLVARLGGWSEERCRERVRELAALARLSEALLERWPHELSGGERQRVGLMRALMLDPDVLLLDEPLGALDPIVRARLQEDLRAAFIALEKCVLVVTHDMAEAAYLADTIAVVRDGSIIQRGTMKQLVDAPAHPFVRELALASRSLGEALA
ncbi:MAG: L-proline glycine betaine transport system permease protein ProV [Labilithrix sp.]|nr:L-proline glycine betaine transport system permease protein ProV [Labilithrix sp.]